MAAKSPAWSLSSISYHNVSEITAAAGREIVRELSPGSSEDTIYVAVGKEVGEGKSNLAYALNTFKADRICIIHVFVPAERIPCLGAKFPKSAPNQLQVRAYRELEKQEMHKILDDYLAICLKSWVRAEKLLIASKSIEKGIVGFISSFEIRKLVMGAAADRHHSIPMVDLSSKKAIYVREHAPAYCHIQFICKGYLVQARQGNSLGIHVVPSQGTVYFKGLANQRETGNATIYDLLTVAASANQVASGETLSCAEAERHAIEAIRGVTTGYQAEISEILYTSKMKHPEEVEKARAKERKQLDDLRNKNDQLMRELQIVRSQKSIFENRVAELSQMVKVLEHKLQTHRNEQLELQVQCADAIREAEELRKLQGEASSKYTSQHFFEFSLSEIKEATWNFDPSWKIGEGGYGSIYKGILRTSEVAIKVVRSKNLRRPSEFLQEAKILSKMRHPNLVRLVGVCEARILIYEYLPNGSLDDRLRCKDNSAPLTWQSRIFIATELCLALLYLHANQSESVVHGNLNPTNVLFDANNCCKLGDFGLCRLVSEDGRANIVATTLTNPMGSFPYVDPEFFSTGTITVESDVYSFGIIVLQLLTAKPALGIANEVQNAINGGRLKDVLDTSAGDWPLGQAEQLAQLALRCCVVKRKKRPGLEAEIWRELEPMRALCATVSLIGFEEPSSENCHEEKGKDAGAGTGEIINGGKLSNMKEMTHTQWEVGQGSRSSIADRQTLLLEHSGRLPSSSAGCSFSKSYSVKDKQVIFS